MRFFLMQPGHIQSAVSSYRLVIGLLLLQLLHQYAPLLVFAPLVLEPDTDHPWAEAGHLH